MRERMLFDVFTPEEPTFHNFHPEYNVEVFSKALLYSNLRRFPGLTLMLWGPPGCGKSHLLHAARESARSDGFKVGDAAEGYGDLAGLDMVVADGVEQLDEAGQERLFLALDSNRLKNRPTVFAASRCPPAELEMREDLRTRLGSCLVIGMRPLDDRSKRLALVVYSRRLGREVDAEVVDHILKRHPRNLGQLFAVLRKLDYFAVINGKTLNLRTVREWEERSLGEGK